MGTKSTCDFARLQVAGRLLPSAHESLVPASSTSSLGQVTGWRSEAQRGP